MALASPDQTIEVSHPGRRGEEEMVVVGALVCLTFPCFGAIGEKVVLLQFTWCLRFDALSVSYDVVS